MKNFYSDNIIIMEEIMEFKITNSAKEKMAELKNNQQPIKLKITGYS